MRELPQVGALRVCVDDVTSEYFIYDATKVPNLDTCEDVLCDVAFQSPGGQLVDGVTPESLLVVLIDRLTMSQLGGDLPVANCQVVTDHLRAALLSLTA